MPRKGHVEALIDIFAYHDKPFGKTIIIHLIIPNVNTSMEIRTNWLKSIYGKGLQEEIPTNITQPLGNPMLVNVFVDTSHAGDKLTFMSHT